jgi:hypothetical protein
MYLRGRDVVTYAHAHTASVTRAKLDSCKRKSWVCIPEVCSRLLHVRHAITYGSGYLYDSTRDNRKALDGTPQCRQEQNGQSGGPGRQPGRARDGMRGQAAQWPVSHFASLGRGLRSGTEA